jgi:uncharacterized protein YcbK (DUF882 family)
LIKLDEDAKGFDMREKDKGHSRISDHFSTRDFVCRCGVCNQSIRLSLGLVGGLEQLRALSKSRINIMKGYMCQDADEASKGTRRNYHTYGIAADVKISGKSLKETLELVEQVEEFKGIGVDLVNEFVHVDVRKEDHRAMWIEKDDIVTDIDDKNREKLLGFTSES